MRKVVWRQRLRAGFTRIQCLSLSACYLTGGACYFLNISRRNVQSNAMLRREGRAHKFIAVHLLENLACLSAGSLSNAIVYSTSMPGVRPVHCCIFSTIAMPSQPATDVLSEHRSLTSLASFVFKSQLRTQISSTIFHLQCAWHPGLRSCAGVAVSAVCQPAMPAQFQHAQKPPLLTCMCRKAQTTL